LAYICNKRGTQGGHIQSRRWITIHTLDAGLLQIKQGRDNAALVRGTKKQQHGNIEGDQRGPQHPAELVTCNDQNDDTVDSCIFLKFFIMIRYFTDRVYVKYYSVLNYLNFFNTTSLRWRWLPTRAGNVEGGGVQGDAIKGHGNKENRLLFKKACCHTKALPCIECVHLCTAVRPKTGYQAKYK
jgi:hypothetical protein